MDQPDEAFRKQSATSGPRKAAVMLQYRRRRHFSGCPKPRPPITAVFYRKRKKNVPAPAPIPEVSKKTRCLPNMSECQACGIRIDLTDGKNRLQTLYSEWRVVLLCGKCLSRVDSSVVCSYCFTEISGEELCCGCCKRLIHRNCFLDCKDLPPWSYSCSGSEFSVCIDCCVPKSVLNKQQVQLRSKNKNKKVEVVCALRSTGFIDIGDHNKILEIAQRVPSYLANSENEAAAVDNGELLKDDIMATSSSPSKEAVNNGKAVDDEGLAPQLHHSLNRSARISKKKQNRCSMVFKRTLKPNGHIPVRIWESRKASADGKHQMFLNDEEKDAAKTSLDLHLPEVDGVANGLQHFTCQINYDNKENMMEVMNEGEGSCSNGLVTEIKNFVEQDELVKPKNERHAEKPDYCLIKYRRRKLSSNVNIRTEIRCDKNHL